MSQYSKFRFDCVSVLIKVITSILEIHNNNEISLNKELSFIQKKILLLQSNNKYR